MNKYDLMIEKDVLLTYKRLLRNRVDFILNKFGCNDDRALVFSSAYQSAISYLDFVFSSFDSSDLKKGNLNKSDFKS